MRGGINLVAIDLVSSLECHSVVLTQASCLPRVMHNIVPNHPIKWSITSGVSMIHLSLTHVWYACLEPGTSISLLKSAHNSCIKVLYMGWDVSMTFCQLDLYQRLNVLPSKSPIITCRSGKTAYQHMTYLNWAQCSRVKNILISLYRHESALWLMRRPPFPVPFMLLLVASYQIGKISSLVIVIAIAENIWFIYSASQGVTEKDVCNAMQERGGRGWECKYEYTDSY